MIPVKDSIRLARVPIVTIGLIVANVVVYLVAVAHGGSLIDGPSATTITRFGAIPYELTHPGSHCALAVAGVAGRVLCSGQAAVSGRIGAQPATWATVFTGMFLHANLLQLAGNMVFLAVFGITLEDGMGRVRFLAFYLLGGLAALGLAVAFAPDSATPALGSSGALAAVLGGYVASYRRTTILNVVLVIFFFSIVELPAWTIVGLWLVFDVLLGALRVATPFGGAADIAYYALISGLAFGLVAAHMFGARRRRAITAAC